MHDVMLEGTLDEHINIVFNAIDQDGDGFFGFEEIMRQFQKLGAKCEPEEAMDVFNRVSNGKTHFISFSTFFTSLEICSKWLPGIEMTNP